MGRHWTLSAEALQETRAYTTVGITVERRKRAIYYSIEAAEKASTWVWIKRTDPWETQNTQ